FGELNDQDGVLGGESDQHHQSDLRIHVVLNLNRIRRHEIAKECTTQPQDRKGPEYCNWNAHHHAERQRPALIKRNENQETKQCLKAKDHGGRDSVTRFLFLKGDARLIEAHLPRHGLLEYIFECVGCLVGAVARRGAAVDLRRPVFVESQGDLGTDTRLDSGEGGQRNFFSVPVAHIELTYIFRFRSILAFGLDIYLPLPSESVEVVDKDSPHEGLNRTIYIVKGNSLFQHFVPVHVYKLLGNAGQKGGADIAYFRALSSRIKKRREVFCKELNIAARTIFQHIRESA